jgi:hypothetical protein
MTRRQGPSDATVGVDAAPEFVPKRNYELIVDRGWIAAAAARRLEIGDDPDPFSSALALEDARQRDLVVAVG